MRSEIEKTAHFCMFLLFNFSSIFRGGQLTQFAPVRAAPRGKWGQLTCGRPCSLPSLLGLLSHPRFTHSLPYYSLLLRLSLARKSGLLSTLPTVDDLPARRTLRSTNTNRLMVYHPSNCQQSAAEPLRLRLHTSGIHC